MSKNTAFEIMRKAVIRKVEADQPLNPTESRVWETYQRELLSAEDVAPTETSIEEDRLEDRRAKRTTRKATSRAKATSKQTATKQTAKKEAKEYPAFSKRVHFVRFDGKDGPS